MNSISERHRAAWAKWVGKPPGLPPDMAAEFIKQMEAGKSHAQLTNARGPHYIAARERVKKHGELNPEFAKRVAELAPINAQARLAAGRGAHNRQKTHCKHGHDLAVHGHIQIQKNGWKWRRCRLCTEMHSRAGGVIRPEAFANAETLLRKGLPLSKVVKHTVRRWPVFQKYRALNPEFERIIEQTRIVRVAQTRIIRAPNLTGILAGTPDATLAAAQAAVSERVPYDIRQEAISLTVMDVLERRITFNEIAATARRHVSRLYSQDRYRQSLDAPIWNDSATTRLDMLTEGIWQ
ncbi:hypothetical protein [Bradyrhizobium retamae]|uniref:Uncharacterized protein n=1 Tax=Bradyrhizobium retamae TaxID=1300035 RepID=A0A0R3MVY7_9BRAD|nr:hypothetical protein [Bradyrhizobium retamae]KRR21875.1 hypothetical protein CQ13_07515 [Bradyrhizobium retamae]